MKNQGTPGVDEFAVTEFNSWLEAHWPKIRQALLAGEFMPAAVRKVETPKPQGGIRTLSIPTALFLPVSEQHTNIGDTDRITCGRRSANGPCHTGIV